MDDERERWFLIRNVEYSSIQCTIYCSGDEKRGSWFLIRKRRIFFYLVYNLLFRRWGEGEMVSNPKTQILLLFSVQLVVQEMRRGELVSNQKT